MNEQQGAFNDSFVVDLSSQAFLTNKSLLEMIKGLMIGGLNSTMKKKGLIHVNKTTDKQNIIKRYVNENGARCIPFA